MTFRVGQKVVCVDDGIRPRGYCPAYGYPTIGVVYTISEVGVTYHGAPGVNLVEHPHERSSGWRASRFRPVVERKTDISILTALLVPGAKIRETV